MLCSCPVVFISFKIFEIFILFLNKVSIFSLVQVTENIFRGDPLFHQNQDFRILLFLGLWRTDTKVTRPWVTGDTTTPPTSPPTSRCIPRSRRAGRSLNKDSECRRQRRKVRYQNACGYSILPVVLSSKYCACPFNLLHLFPESWYSEARLVSSSEFTLCLFLRVGDQSLARVLTLTRNKMRQHDEEDQTIIIQNIKLIVLILVIRLAWWKIRPKLDFFSSVTKAWWSEAFKTRFLIALLCTSRIFYSRDLKSYYGPLLSSHNSTYTFKGKWSLDICQQ